MSRRVFQLSGRTRRDGQEPAQGALLTEQQHELIAEEVALLERLGDTLGRYPATQDDREAIERAIEHLAALFMLVIVGEFNAGKSAFINALVGADVMPEGVTPTTSVINLLRYGTEPAVSMQPDGVIVRTYPAEFLDDITVVDTPGTNAIIREHEALTQQFVPRSDMVLFVTSADRPFTESERAFMESIRDWGKKIVVIINKADLLRDAAAVAEVTAFVTESIERLLGFTPEVFAVSSLQARQAKALGERNPEERARLWASSGFGPLEEFIFVTLDEEGRVRLKLLSPLGVAEKITEKYQQITADRLAVLRDDLATIDNIERQLVTYQEDMRRQFTYHLTRIENIIARMLQRGDAFFEETIRLGRVFDLLNKDKIRGEFERQVVSGTEEQIDTVIDELIDWMVDQDLRIWKSVTDYIDRRRLTQYEEGLIGEVGGQFRYDRRALLESVAKRAQEEVDRYDLDSEARELADSVRNAVATVAVAEAGAVGLGALIVAAASTVAVDVTGILAASLLAGLGLFVLPNKRRQAKRDFHARSEELEQRLIAVMREQFEHELARSMDRVREAIAPYTRFVRSQYDHLTQMGMELTAVDNDLRALRHRIGVERALAPGERTFALPPAIEQWFRPPLPVGNGDVVDVDVSENRPQAPSSSPSPRQGDGISRPEDI
ncbi:MAG: dynamin family protein [Thermomicrobiales bacterium]